MTVNSDDGNVCVYIQRERTNRLSVIGGLGQFMAAL